MAVESKLEEINLKYLIVTSHYASYTLFFLLVKTNPKTKTDGFGGQGPL